MLWIYNTLYIALVMLATHVVRDDSVSCMYACIVAVMLVCCGTTRVAPAVLVCYVATQLHRSMLVWLNIGEKQECFFFQNCK